jgi:cyclophilin family peptidyl-prolyl cis-trans isomerase
MARTQVVDSATSQFFINVNDNVPLDHRDKSARGYGYAVFGKVVNGMDVVDQIVSAPTTTIGPFQDVPREDISIVKARRKEQ